MKINNSFDVPIEANAALDVLTDVTIIAPCVPGVELTENLDGRKFIGNASVRLGPVALTFSGEAEILEVDKTTYTAKVFAKGADKKGRGGAEANVSFKLTNVDGNTRVDVETDLELSGSIAQYGRASGLIEGVAQQIIEQFADELRQVLSGRAVGSPRQEISGMKVLFRAIFAKFSALFTRKAKVSKEES